MVASGVRVPSAPAVPPGALALPDPHVLRRVHGGRPVEVGRCLTCCNIHYHMVVRAHSGEYVAIAGGRVIDHDVDFEALALRVFRRVGVGPVFMPRVEREARRMRLRSPRRSVA